MGILFAVLNSHDGEYQDQGLLEYEVSTLWRDVTVGTEPTASSAKDRDCRFLRNVCVHVPDYRASHFKLP